MISTAQFFEISEPVPTEKPYAVIIVGPTATGKTAVGINVAEAIDGEIISADSRQIYTGMAIGSGAPSTDELDRIPHYLVGCVDPDRRLSAGDFARMARSVAAEILKSDKIPVIVGGSGLYVRALLNGLAPIPAPDENIRRDIEEQIDREGMERMIERLRGIDPEYAEKVNAGDRKRLVRALEVFEATGKSFTEWHKIPNDHSWCIPLFYGLNRPHGEIHGLIVMRVDKMIETGWIDEVRNLIVRYGRPENLPPSITEALGYGDILDLLDGKITIDKARDNIIIATRQFAKRQMTWFRADTRINWLDGSGDQVVDKWSGQIISSVEKIIGFGVQTMERQC